MPHSFRPDPTTPGPRRKADTPPTHVAARPGRPPGSLAAHPTRRAQEQLVLRAAGFSYGEIATLFGISKQAVHQTVRRWSGRQAPSA